jgi:catechol 2,3-dioxygenase-like lactoylglutathione lyase family enzyme
MNYQLEHVAIYTKDITASIQFYEKFFGGHPTPDQKGRRPAMVFALSGSPVLHRFS